MKTNLLKAILNVKELNTFDFEELYSLSSELYNKNSMQNIGDALETFVKDAFSNSFYEVEKDKIYSKYFSYLGNANNPPDLIIKWSDAVEIKKLESYGDIQLNSSFPKSFLYHDDNMITKACQECEQGAWVKKGMIYAIGNVKDHELKALFFVYGDCFAASPEIYKNIKNKLSDTIASLPTSELTNELGRINKVDPLGVTKLRIRGMWLLKHPLAIFNNIIDFNQKEQKFSLMALMKKDKFNSFPDEDKQKIKESNNINIKEVEINYPDNPAKLIKAVFLRYDKK